MFSFFVFTKIGPPLAGPFALVRGHRLCQQQQHCATCVWVIFQLTNQLFRHSFQPLLPAELMTWTKLEKNINDKKKKQQTL